MSPSPDQSAGQGVARTGPFAILKNAMSGALSRVAMMVIGFSLTPFIINALGIQRYGLWAVVGSLAGYLGLLDFGLGGAFVKFITEYVERNEPKAARQVITFGLLFYAVFGIVLATPVIVCAPWIVHAFKMPAEQYASAAQLLRWMFVLLVITMMLNIPGMAVVSLQRMDLASRNGFVGYLAYAIIAFVLLRLGYGLPGLVIASAAQALVGGALQYETARRMFGPLWHNPLRLEARIVKRLFAFSGWTQLTSIFQVINLDIGRFVAAGVVSVGSVGYYEIGSKVAYFSRSFPAYLLSALMPAASSANARGDESKLRRIYAAGTRYQMFATLGFVGLIVGGVDPLIRVWLGKPYPFVATIRFWLGAGYAISGLNGVATTILKAMGKPRYETQYVVVGTIGNIASTLVLARVYGIVGVAMATAFGWLLGTIYFNIIFTRIHHSPWWHDVGSPTVRLVISCTVSSLCFWTAVHVPQCEPIFKHRSLGCLILAILSIAYCVAFAGLSWILGVWRDDTVELTSAVVRIKRTLPSKLVGRFAGRGAL
jgi:O-antigen/teichoic acid export membrane protein